jgi:hypothetical protein
MSTTHEQSSETPASATRTPVFTSTDRALRFALRFAAQQSGASSFASIVGSTRATSLGLAGVDGAAQAGMIRAEIDKLNETARAVLIAHYAPPDLPCECRRPCCSGRVPNAEWTRAVTVIARDTTPLFAGRVTLFRLRQTLIGNILQSVRETDVSLAQRYGVHRQTVAEHAEKLETALLGTRQTIGELTRAIGRVDTLLHAAGIVGEHDEESA